MKLLNVASGLAALVAAVLWFWSAKVRVKYKDIVEAGGFQSATILDGTTDVLETIKAANFWSIWASIAAGLSALCQAIAAFPT